MATERSISTLLQDIVGNIQEIVRAEVNLAKAELRQEASKALSSGVWLAAGSVSGVFAALFLLTAIAFALALVMPAWAAALTVGAVLALGAGILLSVGIRRLKSVRPAPERPVETIKENVEWLKSSK